MFLTFSYDAYSKDTIVSDQILHGPIIIEQ